MRAPHANVPNKSPSAMGVMTWLACSRARQEGVDVELLLRKAGLMPEQIDDHRTRLDVKRQIKFLDLVAMELRDELLGFIWLKNMIFARSDCFTTRRRPPRRWAKPCGEALGIVRSSTRA